MNNVFFSLANRDICSSCGICCKYDNNDLWDSPCFTEHEKDVIVSLLSNITFLKRASLFYPELIVTDAGEYMCPFLSQCGCILTNEKPFKCSIWPLYVVKVSGKNHLAISTICPQAKKVTCDNIEQYINSDLIKSITKHIKKHPQLIEKMRDTFTIVMSL